MTRNTNIRKSAMPDKAALTGGVPCRIGWRRWLGVGVNDKSPATY